MNKITQYINLACVTVSSITAMLFVLISYHVVEINPTFFTGIRILNVLLLLILALHRKSLTVWILISIVTGAEFGYDLPEIARNMQFLSDIFLRLIKTIIADPRGIIIAWLWIRHIAAAAVLVPGRRS